jgi:hypothetical protein
LCFACLASILLVTACSPSFATPPPAGPPPATPPPAGPPPAAPPPAGAAPAAFAIPAPGIDAHAPRIFNASGSAQPGDVISLQGANLGPKVLVWLAAPTAAGATPLPIVNGVGTTQLAVQLPAALSGGMVVWAANSHGASNSVKLNGAVPSHLDAMQIVPGGAFRVLGRNLLMPGFTPTVTVDGQAAAIQRGASNDGMLVVSAPPTLSPTSRSLLMVDNGNGTGPAPLDRTISVVPGSGDPFSLGVGWGAGFTFANHVISVNTPCDGSHDDSLDIQKAIAVAAAGGGVVRLPAGTCILASPLTLSSSVVLEGAGKDLTVVEYQVNYPIASQDHDLVGLRNFTLRNAGRAQQGLLWKQNTRSFLQGMKIDMGLSHQLFLTANQNFVVSQTDFIQRGSLGEQNPYLFSSSSGLVFVNNTTTSIDGSPTFQSVHDALILHNRFTRDAGHQNESPVIATHMFVIDFAYRIAVIDNIFDVIHGPVTNTDRNDGETLLTEGGGGSRTENMGTVSSATDSTITDTRNTINVNRFSNGLPENYGIAIVHGTGAGQTREVTGYSGSTLQVDHPWEVIPDTTSRYATFVWGLEKGRIAGNKLIGNPRGIWLYQTAIRDVDLLDNSITNGGGIFLRSYQSRAAKQFDPMYNVRIAGNHISNSDGVWMSYVDVVFVNKDHAAFGTAATGIEIRRNTLTANEPNVTSNTEDKITGEGFADLVSSEASAGPLRNSPMIIGTIFQQNRCAHCRTAFVIGSGDYGTVLIANQPAQSSASVADRKTLGPVVGASIGTLIR